MRVTETQHDKIQAMADALGVSAAALIDRMLEREVVDEYGRPRWWREMVPHSEQCVPPSAVAQMAPRRPRSRPTQEELPLKTA